MYYNPLTLVGVPPVAGGLLAVMVRENEVSVSSSTSASIVSTPLASIAKVAE